MDPTSEEIDHHRRRLIGTAAMTVSGAQFGMIAFANAHPRATKNVLEHWRRNRSRRR